MHLAMAATFSINDGETLRKRRNEEETRDVVIAILSDPDVQEGGKRDKLVDQESGRSSFSRRRRLLLSLSFLLHLLIWISWIPPLGSIPKIIWLTAKAPSLSFLSADQAFCVDSWRRLNPEYTIIYHNDTEAEHFMCTKLEAKLCNTYRQMPLPVMKADMWRYAVLYIHGGVYADINAEDRVPIQEWGIDRCGL